MIRIPGLIDTHVHMRDPGQTHKEGFDTGTAAALAGGYTSIVVMPNTTPPVTDVIGLAQAREAAKNKARCDYGFFAAASTDNMATVASLAPQVCGLKIWLDSSFGNLLIKDGRKIETHVRNWPANRPIVAHAEGGGKLSLGFLLFLSQVYNKRVHILHVATKDEILLIRAAKEKGVPVTCETAPQYLVLTQDDISSIGAGFSETRPRLGTPRDRDALLKNLDIIDCFATDHAPHTVEEKIGSADQEPSPGYPGLETSLGLLLGLFHEGYLEIDELVKKMHTNPRQIFNLPNQEETYTEVDLDETWVVNAKEFHSRCKWTPFEGMKLKGRVKRVVIRGKPAYEEGKVLSLPACGREMLPLSLHTT